MNWLVRLRHEAWVLCVFAGLTGGCVPPMLPVSTTPFDETRAPAPARLTASVAVFSGLPNRAESGWLRGPVIGGTVAWSLLRNYRLDVGGSAFALGAEGDLVVLRTHRMTLGILHGLELAPVVQLTSCLLGPCHASFSLNIAYDLEAGVLLNVEVPRLGTFAMAARVGSAGGTNALADPATPSEVQGLLAVGLSRRLGDLRITPQVAVLVIEYPGRSAWYATTTWAIVPTLSISTDL